ncbi:uncharacterized protein LOC120080998 [Benincasa hispida]|uniref:uncharacterized protein LOC120080998 n=1 Tax=Benincasa hispida TaxID=102211 RepID=UPI001901289B|nr:uncharacterized protein LOC120080998 [Benincasa hispida]
MTSAIISLLGTDKLTKKNHVTWKNMINIILVIDNLKFVLTKKCSPISRLAASRNVREAYDKWTKANNKARVYMLLASLTEVLDKKHEPMITARDIIKSLRGMFNQPATHLKHDALKYIFNTQMNEGSSIREHVLSMMVHFNAAEMNEVVIDESS